MNDELSLEVAELRAQLDVLPLRVELNGRCTCSLRALSSTPSPLANPEVAGAPRVAGDEQRAG
eukprot:6738949-Prymnesium_polylepis.1